MKIRITVPALLSLALTLQAFGMTYKSTYSVPCNELWSAVKDTLSNPESYTVKENDDAKMHASYDVKHSAHVNISGARMQRTNKVTLLPKGTGCEMQVVANYSGWEHNDQGDFKKRVDDALLKLQAPKPADPAKPAGATK